MQHDNGILPLAVLSANLHALTTHVRGTQEQPDFSRLRGKASGEIVVAGVVDLFSKEPFAFIAECLRRTHLSYHALRDQLLQRDVVPLQTYVKQGCEGEVVDVKEIVAHLEAVSKFCLGTRPFFNNIPVSAGLKGVFSTYFCEECTANGRLIQNYFQLFLLQRDYGTRLPYTTLSFFVRHKKMGDLLDLFLIEGNKSKLTTPVLHRGLDCFLEIHRLLFPEQTLINDVAEIEFALQNRRTQLLNKKIMTQTNLSLCLEPDPAQLSWRRSLRRGDKVIINEACGNEWVKTEVTLGEMIGKSRGNEDRYTHFQVTHVRETRIPLGTAKDLMIIGQRGEQWRELPNNVVLTIPFNRAVLGIKRHMGQVIVRAENNFPFNCAGLTPLMPLRLDEQGTCALFPLLGQLPAEKKAQFGAAWIVKVDTLPYIPKPFPDFNRILYGPITMGEETKNCVCYPRNLKTRPKDPALVELFKRAIRDYYNVPPPSP